MLSPEAYEERCVQLERARERRHAQVPQHGWPWSTFDGGPWPAEVAPGRGDLRFTSRTWTSDGYATYNGYVPMLASGMVSYAQLFMSQPWIAAAVMRMLTWAVRVPLKTYRRDSDDPNARTRLRQGEHVVADMIAHPWERGSAAQLVMALLGPVLVHGNSVAEILDVDERIRLDPKDWRYAVPVMPWRDSLEGFRFDTDEPAFEREVSIQRVLHLAWWSPAGPPREPIGVSPLQQLGTTLGIENAAQRYQTAVFQQGGRPPSAVTVSESFLGVEPEERRQIMAQLRADLVQLYGGPENMGKPALLPPGLDWKAIGGSPVEAALIDQRKITREEIAAVYQIPPPMLGILDKATYSNIATQREMAYTDCMGPPLVLIEQGINSQIIRDLLGQEDIYVEFDFGAVLRGDRVQEINALRTAISSALMNPNEGRSVLNLPRVDTEGMDDYYLPTNNLTPVGLAMRGQGAGQRVRVEPAATPEARALYVSAGGREYVHTWRDG